MVTVCSNLKGERNLIRCFKAEGSAKEVEDRKKFSVEFLRDLALINL
jgi:hypothetical protein